MATMNPNEIIGKVFSLNNMVEYQQDSVVSRTLIDSAGGTITLFAFDKGQGLSEHTAPFDAVVYLLDGEAEIMISGISYRLRKGQIITMPANKPHSLKALEQFKMMLIMIRSETS